MIVKYYTWIIDGEQFKYFLDIDGNGTDKVHYIDMNKVTKEIVEAVPPLEIDDTPEVIEAEFTEVQ